MSDTKRKGTGGASSKIPVPSDEVLESPGGKRILRSQKTSKPHWALLTDTRTVKGKSLSPPLVVSESKTRVGSLRKQSSLNLLPPPAVVTNNKDGKGITQLQKLQRGLKNQETLRKAKGVLFQGTSWVDRSYPQNLEDLFVHKKKVEEVQSWLSAALGLADKHHSRPFSKICVLTGPSGSGKTATLFMAAKGMNVEIKEWINPMSLTDFQPNRLGKFDPDEVQGRSQFDLFSHFIFRASQYNTLPIKGRPKYAHKIVVVEDFPNMFYRNFDLFQNSILRPYNTMGGCPIVFIIADSASRDSNVYSLFPKPIIQELNIAYISFNSVATTYMVKFMMSVCLKEGVSVDKSVIEDIAMTSDGDVRCAINTLQFKLSNGKASTHAIFKAPANKRGTKPPKKGQACDRTDSVQKDETLFLFRALGKVLYAKRDCDKNVELHSKLDVHSDAQDFLRPNPLEENPEELVHKIEVPAENFLSFLQQNYIPFFGSMEDIVLASSLMADAEHIISRWPFDDSGTVVKGYKDRESREEVALLIASRGLMYSNVKKTPNSWRPLKKPMFGDVRVRIQKSIEAVNNLFYKSGAVQGNFYTEVLPYYAKLQYRHRNNLSSDQMNFIDEIGTFKKGFRRRNNQDTLNERDVDMAEETSDNEENNPHDCDLASEPNNLETNNLNKVDDTPLNQNKLSNEYEDEEDYTIEEYDST